MKSLCLLWFMKTKATVRNLFKKPSSAIFTIFIVLLYGFVFYSFLFLPKDQSYMVVNFELHSSILLFVGFLALMLFSTMLSSRKALFSGEDAYFLFSGPFHKKQIMTFLTFQTFLQSILLSFFALIFFIGMNMGISVDFGFIGLALLGSMLTIMIFLVFIDYSYILSIGDQKYKKINYIIAGIFGIVLVIILGLTYLETGRIQTIMIDFIESPLFYFVPVFGWLKLTLISYVTSQMGMVCLGLLLLLVSLVIIYLLFITYKGDFYEQALQDSLELSKQLKEFKAGNQDALRNVKVKKTSVKRFYDGAYAVLSKNLLLMKKKGNIISWNDIISIGIYLVITIFSDLGFGFFIYMMIIWLFMMMQTSDLVGELKNYQIYLIPDKPYKKLIAVMIPTFMKVSIIGTLSFIVVGMYYHETFLTIFMYLINMFGYIFIFMSASVLTIRLLKSRTTQVFENMMRMLIMIVSALPSVILTVIFMMTNALTPTVLTMLSMASLAMNFILALIILWTCQGMMNGRELKSE